MKIVSMLDDYRAMCAAAEKTGSLRHIYLYQCPLEALQEYIEAAYPGLD